MPISTDRNKTLPFTLIEVMALLVFVLMLSFAGITLSSESAKTCDDEVDEEAGEKCSPITETDFNILSMYACDTTEQDCGDRLFPLADDQQVGTAVQLQLECSRVLDRDCISEPALE